MNAMLFAALDYLARGISVAPQVPGTKKTFVRWKELQQRRPTRHEVRTWWDTWPDAGVAIILGPVSDLLAVDVDGPEAHAALVARLGDVPVAPRSRSGSRKPKRYHLLFLHPGLKTGAKYCPWHEGLEFRGHGGIIVAPPSLHQSGRRYRWADGRSLDDLHPPAVPGPILQALETKPTRQISTAHLPPRQLSRAQLASVTLIPRISPRTRAFLRGDFADAAAWNSRLFAAACDMAGCGIPQAHAVPLLLRGAGPWSDGDLQAALRTIASAFSEPRSPALRAWRRRPNWRRR